MLQSSITAAAVVAIIAALFGIALLWRGREWFVYWLKGSAGLVLLSACIIAIFTLVDLWSYRQLLHEQSLATLSVYQLGDQSFDVTLAEQDGEEERYKITGDQWQLDARLLTWTGPFAAAGAQPLYRLDRLSGRYLSLEQERSAERSVYSLSESRWFDLWKSMQGENLWLDAHFGSAVYMPLINGAVFSVHLTPKGLIARPVNDVAEQALRKDW